MGRPKTRSGPELSGGKRATERKQRLASEANNADPEYRAKELEAFDRDLGPGPADARRGAEWIFAAQARLARIALHNPAVPLSQAIDQAQRCLAGAGKCIDAAKLRAELDDLLTQLNAPEPDGAQIDSIEAGRGEAPGERPAC